MPHGLAVSLSYIMVDKNRDFYFKKSKNGFI